MAATAITTRTGDLQIKAAPVWITTIMVLLPGATVPVAELWVVIITATRATITALLRAGAVAANTMISTN